MDIKTGKKINLAAFRARPRIAAVKAPGPAPGEEPPLRAVIGGGAYRGRMVGGASCQAAKSALFHPIHRKTGMIQSRRLTVLWRHQKRMLRNDDWRTMTEPMRRRRNYSERCAMEEPN